MSTILKINIIILTILLPASLLAQESKCSDSPACGISFTDWCCTAKEDPCSRHKNKTLCKQDNKCEGLKYKGESAIVCIWDDRGFSNNCPTVGCISKCENLTREDCIAEKNRCRLAGRGCANKFSGAQ
jgi:hypothetical protein